MDAIRVHLREPTAQGRLYYQHTPSVAHIVVLVESFFAIPFSYMISIQGVVNLGMNAERILQQIEFIGLRSRWIVTTPIETPKADLSANLEITDVWHRNEMVELPVQIITDERMSYICAKFGEIEQDGSWVAMSEQCLALIVEGRLKGFFVALESTG